MGGHLGSRGHPEGRNRATGPVAMESVPLRHHPTTGGQILTVSPGSNTVCPDGSNSSVYSPQTCIGHGI